MGYLGMWSLDPVLTWALRVTKANRAPALEALVAEPGIEPGAEGL